MSYAVLANGTDRDIVSALIGSRFTFKRNSKKLPSLEKDKTEQLGCKSIYLHSFDHFIYFIFSLPNGIWRSNVIVHEKFVFFIRIFEIFQKRLNDKMMSNSWRFGLEQRF